MRACERTRASPQNGLLARARSMIWLCSLLLWSFEHTASYAALALVVFSQAYYGYFGFLVWRLSCWRVMWIGSWVTVSIRMLNRKMTDDNLGCVDGRGLRRLLRASPSVIKTEDVYHQKRHTRPERNRITHHKCEGRPKRISSRSNKFWLE